MHKFLVFFIAISVLAACDSSDRKKAPGYYSDRTPMATVAFLSPPQFKTYDPTIAQNVACITIYPEYFWEPEINADDLNMHIGQNSNVLIDGEQSPEKDGVIWGYPDFAVVDENGRFAGDYAGSIQYCFSTAELTDGHHTATLQTTRLSGEALSLTWEFDVEAGNITVISTPVPNAE